MQVERDEDTPRHKYTCAAMMIHPYKPRDYFSSSSVQARLSILSLILSIIVMLDRQTLNVEPFNTPLPFSLVRLKPRGVLARSRHGR